MSRYAYIGALASLVVVCAPALADWRTPIAGAPPILSSRFEPRPPRPARRAARAVEPLGVSFVGAAPILPTRFLPRVPRDTTPVRLTIEPPPPASVAVAPPLRGASAEFEAAPEGDTPIQFQWVAPLVDRRLPASERTADIAPELIQAIVRIEPMYDPTRLYGPGMPARMGVSAGTASMDNVFADHWQRADLDPNVNQRVPYIAMAWHRGGALPCEAFSKNRARGYNQPALTALSRTDCAVLARGQTTQDAALVPVVSATLAVPVFAAPMPGARMSSVAFWAQRRLEIARAEEEIKLRRLWHGGKEGVSKSFARR